MKKYIARNAETGDKVFCKYEMLKDGILRVEYYLPKDGFSILWEKSNKIHTAGIRTSTDGRKSIVTYLLHPSLWAGCGFQEYYGTTIFTAMDIVAMCNINLHI